MNLPFTIDFFGNSYNSLYVNNNGNVTFNGPLGTYTPEGLTSYGSPIIAPFWGDVDTAISGSALVSYGNGTVAGHEAFGVNWPGVDCYATTGGGLNYFQMVIVNRADIAPGDFDLEFNYNGVNWDSGQASGGGGNCQGGVSAAVGYTNGSTNAFELAGSFENGALLDGGSHALSSGSQNSSVPGRYIFPIRAGGEGSSVTGTVKDNGGASPVGGALVSICSTGGGATACYLGNTGTDGAYSILGVPNGTYAASVSPPRGSSDNEFKSSAFSVTGATTEDFVLTGPTPPPNGTTIEGFGQTEIGGHSVPVINWSVESPITTHACTGGTVTATVTVGGQTTAPVTLTESPSGSGTFSGKLPAVYPLHGNGSVAIKVTNCPVPSQNETFEFSIYVDPSGTVVDGNHGNTPVAGATVTLLSSDSLTGTFTAVEDGSPVMSPANRANPDTSHANGAFGWDTVPGYYEVRATKPKCGTVTTEAFQVPPPQTNLELVLHCVIGFAIETENLPDAARGAAYSAQLEAGEGTTPYKWKKVGELPKGLKLSKTGLLSGTPSAKRRARVLPDRHRREGLAQTEADSDSDADAEHLVKGRGRAAERPPPRGTTGPRGKRGSVALHVSGGGLLDPAPLTLRPGLNYATSGGWISDGDRCGNEGTRRSARIGRRRRRCR